MTTPTLGLAMIMQDEEAHIPTTIAQFYHTVSDIVVVDGGSTDDSVMWAEKMGARVLHRPFNDHFSDQKNFAIDNLETDWIYFNDPDERLEPCLLRLIPTLISEEGQRTLMTTGVLPDSEKPFDCFNIPRKNFIDGEQSSIYPDYQSRLFKKGCRFEGVVHEKLINCTNPSNLGGKDLLNPGVFNILHYKSSSKEEEAAEYYRKLADSARIIS